MRHNNSNLRHRLVRYYWYLSYTKTKKAINEHNEHEYGSDLWILTRPTNYIKVPVVPHKAVAEVLKIGNL